MSKTSVRKIKLGAEKNETGINTVLTIMPPKCYFFQAWHKGKIFFTLSIIQVVARRQYNPLVVMVHKKPKSEKLKEKHIMRNGIIFFIALIIFSSCTNYIQINKHLETNTNKLKVKTTVDNYSSTKKEFYGKITICNQTTDTLKFNFNQTLLIDNIELKSDYNIKPISYACQAFDIKPKDCSTWDVKWKAEKEIRNLENLILKADTTVFLSNCKLTYIY